MLARMMRLRVLLFAGSLLAGTVLSGQVRPAEEMPLQDEKIFQQLLVDYHLLARLLISRNRATEGIPILKAVYELSFRPPTLATELCSVLEKAGLHAETIEILRDQMGREPLNEEWNERLITACERSQNWSEVVTLRTDRRKKHPADLQNLAGLADAYRRLNMTVEADKLVDKIAITARDKLFVFEKPPSPVRDPQQDRIDCDGFAALKLQQQLDLADEFEQYAASFLLRQPKPEYFETVLGWLKKKPPTTYQKSVFPDQQAIGLWLAGKRQEAAALMESKFPARQYPGADRLLFHYYNQIKKPEKIAVRFGGELPEYLKGSEQHKATATGSPSPPDENPDGESGETQEMESP
jgi:hypothetical protein